MTFIFSRKFDLDPRQDMIKAQGGMSKAKLKHEIVFSLKTYTSRKVGQVLRSKSQSQSQRPCFRVIVQSNQDQGHRKEGQKQRLPGSISRSSSTLKHTNCQYGTLPVINTSCTQNKVL